METDTHRSDQSSAFESFADARPRRPPAKSHTSELAQGVLRLRLGARPKLSIQEVAGQITGPQAKGTSPSRTQATEKTGEGHDDRRTADPHLIESRHHGQCHHKNPSQGR